MGTGARDTSVKTFRKPPANGCARCGGGGTVVSFCSVPLCGAGPFCSLCRKSHYDRVHDLPFARVVGNTFVRAPWCSMEKPTMNTSQTGSRSARCSAA